MKAVILAGGVGTRLQPVIGNNNSKLMTKYSEKPLLQRTIEILRDKGITDIVMVVGYQKEKIIEYFGDGKNFEVKIEYVYQKHPKGGTADAVSYAGKKIDDEKFLLIYGDNIFHPDILDKLLEASKNFNGVMCGKEVADPSNYGILEIQSNKVIRIHEKPEKPPSNIANTGLFVLPKEIFSAIKHTGLSPRGEYELTDSIQILINKGFDIGYVVAKEFWCDPRSKEEIEEANRLVEEMN